MIQQPSHSLESIQNNPNVSPEPVPPVEVPAKVTMLRGALQSILTRSSALRGAVANSNEITIGQCAEYVIGRLLESPAIREPLARIAQNRAREEFLAGEVGSDSRPRHADTSSGGQGALGIHQGSKEQIQITDKRADNNEQQAKAALVEGLLVLVKHQDALDIARTCWSASREELKERLVSDLIARGTDGEAVAERIRELVLQTFAAELLKDNGRIGHLVNKSGRASPREVRALLATTPWKLGEQSEAVTGLPLRLETIVSNGDALKITACFGIVRILSDFRADDDRRLFLLKCIDREFRKIGGTRRAEVGGVDASLEAIVAGLWGAAFLRIERSFKREFGISTWKTLPNIDSSLALHEGAGVKPSMKSRQFGAAIAKSTDYDEKNREIIGRLIRLYARRSERYSPAPGATYFRKSPIVPGRLMTPYEREISNREAQLLSYNDALINGCIMRVLHGKGLGKGAIVQDIFPVVKNICRVWILRSLRGSQLRTKRVQGGFDLDRSEKFSTFIGKAVSWALQSREAERILSRYEGYGRVDPQGEKARRNPLEHPSTISLDTPPEFLGRKEFSGSAKEFTPLTKMLERLRVSGLQSRQDPMDYPRQREMLHRALQVIFHIAGCHLEIIGDDAQPGGLAQGVLVQGAAVGSQGRDVTTSWILGGESITTNPLLTREAKLLLLRFGFGDHMPRTIEQIANEMNLSESVVRSELYKLEKALRRVRRHPMVSSKDDWFD